MTTDALLAARDLHKEYGADSAAVAAVAGVDLDLAPGELVAIMGASGSGKSTLLHLLGGLARPDKGSVTFDGEDLTALPDARLAELRRRRIGVIFQAYNLMPTLSALDNVVLPLLLLGTKRRAAIDTAMQRLEQVGMADRATHRPSQMSGGEQQRVTIARALATDPLLVLADEPTGNLDRRNANHVCKLLTEVAKASNRAVVLVTHEPGVAFNADRVVILADGKTADAFPRTDVATVEALATRYLHATGEATAD